MLSLSSLSSTSLSSSHDKIFPLPQPTRRKGFRSERDRGNTKRKVRRKRIMIEVMFHFKNLIFEKNQRLPTTEKLGFFLFCLLCTTWTLTKRLEKNLDGNYTRMLRAILNKSWRQHHTRHQLYGHIPPITKTIQARRTRHAGHCWRSKDELISDVLLWTLTYGQAKQDDQLELKYSSYVRTQDVTLKTCQRLLIIGRSGERGSEISVLAARHDDDDDDHLRYLLLSITYPGPILCNLTKVKLWWARI